jgi:hypothetical protein
LSWAARTAIYEFGTSSITRPLKRFVRQQPREARIIKAPVSRVRFNDLLGGTGLVAIKVSADIVAARTASPDTAWVQRAWSMNGSVSGIDVRI